MTKNKENKDTKKYNDPICRNDVSFAISLGMFWIFFFVNCTSTVTIMTILKN